MRLLKLIPDHTNIDFVRARFFAFGLDGLLVLISMAALVLYGLIGLLGVRIWTDAKVDFADPVNLIVVAAALVAGIGDLTLSVGSVQLGGIAWGSLGILVGYPIVSALAKSTANRRT